MSLLGDEVRRLRESKGFSQEALAELVGVTQGTIGHIETGRQKRVIADLLFALCDALEVGCDHFRPFLLKSTVPDSNEKLPE